MASAPEPSSGGVLSSLPEINNLVSYIVLASLTIIAGWFGYRRHPPEVIEEQKTMIAGAIVDNRALQPLRDDLQEVASVVKELTLALRESHRLEIETIREAALREKISQENRLRELLESIERAKG